MCRLMRAAERARTSSRSSEEFTSSPISARVAKTSAEISAPVFVVCVSVWGLGGFMDSLYYSRRQRACPALFNGFPKWDISFYAGTDPLRHRNAPRAEEKFARYFSLAFFASLESSDRTPTYGKFR